MSDIKHDIQLVVGDWSCDGHKRYVTIAIRCSLDRDGLIDAYKKGARKLKFDLMMEVARAYEDSSIRRDTLQMLKDAGYRYDGQEDDEEDEDANVSLYPEWFADIWLFIARTGDPDMKAEILAETPRITIGGYGLL